jgi:2-polyprenyl-6-methoxyphenol hydroxylase-like FAD-dependent oxidoreductase
MTPDVLIVGAGPTGLMLANQLVRRGVPVRIIDRNPGPALQTRALGVQARTMEIYAHLALGTRATGASIWSQGRRSAHVPLSETGGALSPHPFLLILGQDDNERLLGDLLRSRGVEIEWNTELTGLAQEPNRVTATLRLPDGRSAEAAAAWVAGCDGARSAVRELSGIAFEGAPYEQVFFVADTQATGPMVPNQLNVYLWRQGFHLFFPMKGTDHWRLVGILPPALRGRSDLRFEEVIPVLRQDAGAGLSFSACSWFSTYRIHHRRATRFRKGRCFLLGDAAHIHSPVGAQGMNTGLQDAYNLAWKLALVVAGRAGSGLLETYETERIPVAVRLLETTDRGFSFLVSDRRLAGMFRTLVLPKFLALAMRFQRVRDLAFRTISQTGIRYPHSALSETHGEVAKAEPRAGDRFPWMRLQFRPDGPTEDLFDRLDDTRFHLLVFGQDLPAGCQAALGDLVRTHPIAGSPANARELARARIPAPSFYLLRPDGHIGLCGRRLDAATVTRYASERLQLTAPLPADPPAGDSLLLHSDPGGNA